MRAILILAVAMLGGLAGGCATVTTGTDQSVTILTEPAGASCKMQRAGATIGFVNPTPGSFQITKSKDDVLVVCEKPDHESASLPLGSEFQGMTIGNVILGGVVGVIVDAGSGAMHRYPSEITLLLPPKAFHSVAERDAFYDRAKALYEQRWAKAVDKARTQGSCADQNKTDLCKTEMAQIQKARDAEIASLESRRQSARITEMLAGGNGGSGSGGTGSPPAKGN